jgi:hypothetical protein
VVLDVKMRLASTLSPARGTSFQVRSRQRPSPYPASFVHVLDLKAVLGMAIGVSLG